MSETVIVSDLGEECSYTNAPLPRRGDYCRSHATSEVFDGNYWLFRCNRHRGQVKPGKTGKVRTSYKK